MADSGAADMNDLSLSPEEVSAGLDGTDDFPEMDCAVADSGAADMNDLSLSPEEYAGGRNTAADVMKFAVMIFRHT